MPALLYSALLSLPAIHFTAAFPPGKKNIPEYSIYFPRHGLNLHAEESLPYLFKVKGDCSHNFFRTIMDYFDPKEASGISSTQVSPATIASILPRDAGRRVFIKNSAVLICPA